MFAGGHGRMRFGAVGLPELLCLTTKESAVTAADSDYLERVLNAVRVCRRYRPKFGRGAAGGALYRISHCGAPSGEIPANYIAKYMDDMWAHFAALVPLLNDGSAVHYVVGNSTFYGVLLPVEKLFAAMLRRLGFEHVGERAIRKRNSKKELFEFDVSGRWPGGRA